MADANDGGDGRRQLFAEIGQAVFDRGWRCRHHLAADHAQLLKITQARGQHLRGNIGDVLAQFAEAPWPAREQSDDIGSPGAAQERHAFADRAERRRRFVLAVLEGHDGIGMRGYLEGTDLLLGNAIMTLTNGYLVYNGNSVA